MSKLKVLGKASNKTLLTLELENDLNSDQIKSDLMTVLREKGINIASSCYSEGVCKKCIITLENNEELSCQVKVEQLLNKNTCVEVSYL